MIEQKKIKPLLPSLKERNRYLVFEVISSSKIAFSDVVKKIQAACKSFFGELGMAKAGVFVMPDKWKMNKGIIRLNHDMLDQVKAALTMIKDINGVPVVVQSVGVSGILKKAESKYLRGG